MNWSATETTPTFSEATDALQETGGKIKRTATNALITSEDYVRERPVTTVLTALALGALVGILLRALSHHDEPAYRGRIDHARNWVEDTFGNVRGRVGDTYGNVRERVGDTYGTVRDRVEDTYGNVRERLSDVPDRLREVPERLHLREVPKQGSRGYKAAKKWLNHALDAIAR